jgi:hypothetical protein
VSEEICHVPQDLEFTSRPPPKPATPSERRRHRHPALSIHSQRHRLETKLAQLLAPSTLNDQAIRAGFQDLAAVDSEWVLQGWPEYCSDRGPEGDCSHDYTGYHQICCLNNIPLRADVHRLWDVYEIGVDIHASPKYSAPKRYDLNPTKQDMNCIISFSKGLADLASCHLKVDHLLQQLRPLPALLTDYLSQGVYLWRLFPESQHSSHQHANDLGAVAEGFETLLSPEDDDMDRN